MLNLVVSMVAVYMAIIFRDMIDYATELNSNRFYSTLIFAVFYFLSLGLLEYVTQIITQAFRVKVIRLFRKDVFHGLIKQNVGQFNSVNSADYISKLTNDIQLVDDNFLAPLISIIYNMSQLILSIGLLIYLSPLVTVAVIMCTIFLIIIPSLFSPSVQKRQNRLSQSLSLFTIKIKDVFSGFEIIKSYQMEKHISESFDKKNDDLYKSKLSLGYIYAITTTVSMLLGIFSQLGTLALSAYLITQGSLSVGALFGILQASSQIINPIQGLSNNIPRIRRSKEVIESLLKFTYSVDDDKSRKKATLNERISVRNFTYTYPNQTEVTVNSLNVEFEKNKKYAIIGKSGCGKTTLIKGLIGYLPDYQGQVWYDENELQDVTNESAGVLSSLVHQNVYMFDETIEENITLHQNYPEKELKAAVTDSGVSLFLSKDKALSTKVGENGANLSGGQRQRIAIARALIQKKPLLILDEGTSAIDKETAMDIESKLLKRQDLTLITITHVLDTTLLAQYDEIIYMEAGMIVEKGSLDKLTKLQGKFNQYMNV